MKSYKDQNGFAGLELVLIVVVVVLIAVAGYLVYKNHKKSAPTTTTNSVTASANKSNTPAATTDVATQPKYLTIKEWGVRAPYTSSDTLSYTMTTGNGSVEVISQNLADKYGCKTFGAGLIVRQSPDAVVGPGPGTVAQDAQANPSNYKVINNYYYSFHQDNAACGSISAPQPGQLTSAGEHDQSGAWSATKDLIPMLETIPN